MNKRLISLDVFRGMTIAFMILVNNSGSWSTTYAPLLHADWHGSTPTDWVFPFFLFIVGVAIPLALGKRLEQGIERPALVKKVLTRSAIIFGLGLFLAAYPRFGMAVDDPYLWLQYLGIGFLILMVFGREVLNQPQFTGAATDSKRKLLGYGALGLVAILVVFGFFNYDLSRLRIPGVLQRIALVYLACGLLFLRMSWRSLLITGVAILLSYWAIMTLIPVPIDETLRVALESGDLSTLAIYGDLGNIQKISDNFIAPNLGAAGNIGAWFDRTLMHEHLYRTARHWDPEGIFSTIPAIATGLVGVLTGMWLRTKGDDYKKLTGLLGMGAILLAVGLVWDMAFPINKKIWTSSYVLYMGGISLLFLGVIYWIVDVLDYKAWTKPFVIYGMNPLFAYVLSGLIVKTAINIRWETGDGSTTLWSWIYQAGFEPLFSSPYNSALAFAIANVLICYLAVWALYRSRIFIKV
jgi:predicted acyltransferase